MNSKSKAARDRMSSTSRGRFFERRPGLTLGLFLAVCFVLLDLAAGSLLLPARESAANPYYHHGLKPNFAGEIAWGTESYPVYTDSLGFRVDAPEQDHAGPADRPRLLVLGDSFTEAVGVAYDESFVGLLGDRWADRLDVVNGGARSFSPLLYRLRYEFLRERGWRADTILIMLDISDIQDETRYAGFAPYPGTLKSLVFAVDGWLREHSVLWQNFLREALLGLGHRLRSGSSGGTTSRDQHFADYYEVRDLWTEDAEVRAAWGDRGLELAAEQLTVLQKTAADDGTKIVLAVYPWPRQIEAGDPHSLQVRYWRDFCRRRSIPFIDLFPIFLKGDAGQVIDEYYIEGDVHWTAAGHRLVADELEANLDPIFKPNLSPRPTAGAH